MEVMIGAGAGILGYAGYELITEPMMLLWTSMPASSLLLLR